MKNAILIVITALGCVGLFMLRGNSPVPPYAPLSSSELPTLKEQEQVQLLAKAYTPEESKLYLKKDLVSRGILPVQVTITNNTSKTYLISKKLPFPTTTAKNAAWKVTQDAIPRAVGYKIASFFFWPFLVFDTANSIHTFKAHKALKKDFAAKEFKEEEIAPYSTLNRIIFTPVLQSEPWVEVILIEKGSQTKLALTPDGATAISA